MSLESSICASSTVGTYELNFTGRLNRPHWVVHLCAALAARRISIKSAFATQAKPGDWKARFTLDFSRSISDPMQLNYKLFTEEVPTITFTREPKLSRFDLRRRSDQLVEVRLEGPDQIGFLANVLVKISLIALFPTALDIDTFQGQIRDYIVLRRMGVGISGPSEATEDSLRRMLSSFVVNNVDLKAG